MILYFILTDRFPNGKIARDVRIDLSITIKTDVRESLTQKLNIKIYRRC